MTVSLSEVDSVQALPSPEFARAHPELAQAWRILSTHEDARQCPALQSQPRASLWGIVRVLNALLRRSSPSFTTAQSLALELSRQFSSCMQTLNFSAALLVAQQPGFEFWTLGSPPSQQPPIRPPSELLLSIFKTVEEIDATTPAHRKTYAVPPELVQLALCLVAQAEHQQLLSLMPSTAVRRPPLPVAASTPPSTARKRRL